MRFWRRNSSRRGVEGTALRPIKPATLADRRMLGHQFNHPIDKHAHLDADMPGEGYVHRHAIELPVLEQRDELTPRQMRLGHVIGQPESAQSGEACGDVGIAIIDRQRVAALNANLFTITVHGIGRRSATADRYDAVVCVERQRLFELLEELPGHDMIEKLRLVFSH